MSEETHEQLHRTPAKANKLSSPNKHFRVSCPNLNEIRTSMEPQKNAVKELISDLNQSIDEMFHTVDGYSTKLQGLPSTKNNIMKVLNEQYSFSKELPPGAISKKSKNPLAYLHEGRLYRPRKPESKGETRLEILSKALSEQKISKIQRKEARGEDIKKKQEVIRQIQQRIDSEDQIRREAKETMENKELQVHTLYCSQLQQQRQQQDQHIGSLTLAMISEIRGQYFEQLVSKDSEEKYNRIQDIRDVLIPQQISSVKSNFMAMQKNQLKNELLSKKSAFNSYYQLLALEKSLKRVVNMKLHGDITQYSRFQSAAKEPNYHAVLSPVKSYIHVSTIGKPKKK